MKPDAPMAESRVLLMGIVNRTPDSFSDGGENAALEEALATCLRLAAEGADLVDIGGESTRPGHVPVSPAEETARIVPLFEALKEQGFPLPLSIDTSKIQVAEAALKAGAAFVNDVWGFQRDPDIAAVTGHYGASCILMHNSEKTIEDSDIISDILTFWEKSVALARAAGIAESCIWLDPGIGFGKSLDQNYQILAALPRLAAFGLPLLVGASRKSLIARLFTSAPPPKDRIAGTLALHQYASVNGARMLRVHDVGAHRQMLTVLEKLNLFID
jgi:dihydropteroate synthase